MNTRMSHMRSSRALMKSTDAISTPSSSNESSVLSIEDDIAEKDDNEGYQLLKKLREGKFEIDEDFEENEL